MTPTRAAAIARFERELALRAMLRQEHRRAERAALRRKLQLGVASGADAWRAGARIYSGPA